MKTNIKSTHYQHLHVLCLVNKRANPKENKKSSKNPNIKIKRVQIRVHTKTEKLLKFVFRSKCLAMQMACQLSARLTRLELWQPKDALTEAVEALSLKDNELCAHA